MKPSSSLLLETIKIENGVACNLAYHQRRCDRSRKALFHTEEILDLAAAIKPPEQGLYRCRILYHNSIQHIEYLPYEPKEIAKLKIVASDIDYQYKYADREQFHQILDRYPKVDEVIIEKGGLLTDTTIANIALYDGNAWYTPRTPLLAGTMRENLLEKGLLIPKDIPKTSLHQYTQVALINAMIGFKILNHFTIQT
jgi:4-amino-4-deoxychorismate lyase